MAAITVPWVLEQKKRGQRFAVITAYDYVEAKIAAAAGIPLILVGDTAGMVILGYKSTLPVTMEDMLHHAGAVARGAPDQLLIGDLPFGSYHESDADAIHNAVAFIRAGMHAVKLEGGGRTVELVRRLVERGIPVMGHLGLTPQFIHAFGGFRVQGRQADAASQIKKDAVALQEAGAFSIVLEGVPRSLAAEVTQSVAIPTIGIGAGPECDAQVLVYHDALGLTQGRIPSFAKVYANLGEQAVAALQQYASEVAEGVFPDDAHSYE